MGYFENIGKSIRSLQNGFGATARHFSKLGKSRKHRGVEDDAYFEEADKAVTIQYPMEKIPVPDVGRYRLHMEGEDCIACDKCARICPVDCITIESFKATEDLGYTSDGSKKRLELPVFDIDMAKCCYCGLCTTVCPTECLTMTKVYDFSEYNRDNFIYHFGMLSPEEEKQKREALDLIQLAKKQAVAEKAGDKPKLAKPKLARPKMKKPLLKTRPKKEED
ncbi:MAG: NADH-quinone oxidoreductase subunit I [Bacteroidota bacterium]